MKLKPAILFLIVPLAMLSCTKLPQQAENISTMPDIDPSYYDLTIPCNIAPLNFRINNYGSHFLIRIHGNKGPEILTALKNGNVSIPLKRWKKLLANNINEEISFEVYTRIKNKWYKYQTFKNTVSADSIDPYIAYRRIGAGYILYHDMGIYQRCIENFSEMPIMINEITGNNCMNCHSFNRNNPTQMVLHLREKVNGTVIINNGKKDFINTGTNYTMSAAVYPSWHPSGKYIAFSVNKTFQVFPAKGQNIVVEDKASDIVLLDINNNTITTSPALSTKWLENLPAWSPDGKFLYYISGEKTDSSFEKVKYSLLRIPFNIETLKWGKADTLLSSHETGKSITFPRISPDGKYMIFCLIENGYFSIHEKESDLYLINIETRKYSRLPVNSEAVESYPSWSTNGRWILFVSKRTDNVYSTSWLCHFDKNGNAGKPFILPQEKADFYKNNLYNFNRPEFISAKVAVTPKDLYNLTLTKAKPVKFDKNVDLDALSGATKISPQAKDSLKNELRNKNYE